MNTPPANPSPENDSKYQLEASLPDWCILDWRHLVVCLAFCGIYLALNYMPLAVSTTWHDSWTGSWIANNGLYSVDPSLPLSEGIRHYVDGWAGRVIVHWIHQTGGLEVLSLAYALLYTAIAAIWAWLFVRVSTRFWASLGATAWVVICFQLLNGLSTQTFGALCFVSLVALSLGSQKRNPDSKNEKQFEIQLANSSWLRWLAMLLIGVLWANLDGSFVIGWTWAGVLLVSRVVTLLSSKSGFWADRELKSRLILVELLILAAICNPIGYKIFFSILWWPDNPLVLAMTTLKPISLFSWQGIGLALAILGWFFASRFAIKIRTWQLLSVILGVIAVGSSDSFLIWVLPLILLSTCAMLPRNENENARAPKIEPSESDGNTNEPKENPSLRFAFTLVCGLAIWVSFTFSPASHLLLGGKSRSTEQILGPANPVEAIEAVKQNENKDGLVWCPNYWGDRLQDAEQTRIVFANANSQILPKQALFDYEIIYNGDNGWSKILDRYDITEMLIDKRRQERMLHNLRAKSQGWDRVHEDDKAVVFRKSEANET